MLNKKLILGIETSCDETSAAVLKNGNEVLSLEISSSVPLHQITGGVVPETAAREQLKAIIPIIDLALKNADVELREIDLIAATKGHGLIGSLLVGINAANTLSLKYNTPLVGVPHIWGHMYANMININEEIQFPCLVLTVSGGHNELYLWKAHGDFELLGRTLDDASGEAFDKCGRMMGLDYPAGVQVSNLARTGNEHAYKLPLSMEKSGDLNFSFSGLKTAFLYTLEKLDSIDDKKEDLAASLQRAIVDSLMFKLKQAYKKHPVNEIHISGGVSANYLLRSELEKFGIENKIKTRYPDDIRFCTDNAAMIAAAAYYCDFETGFIDPVLHS